MFLSRLCTRKWLFSGVRRCTTSHPCASEKLVLASGLEIWSETTASGPFMNDRLTGKGNGAPDRSSHLVPHESGVFKVRQLFSEGMLQLSMLSLRGACQTCRRCLGCQAPRLAHVLGNVVNRTFQRPWGQNTNMITCFSFHPGISGLKSHFLTSGALPALLADPVGSLGTCRYYCTGKPASKRKSQTSEEETEDINEKETTAWRSSQSSYTELYENPWTIPNLLCMARIGLSPYLGYLIIEEDFNLALGIFALAGITDLLDGYIARNWANQKSALGSALDPLADKILISVLYISLTYANLIPAPLTAMVIMRDIALIAAVFYIRYKTLLPPRTISKYFNPCYATARLKPTAISKVNTAVQLVLVAASLAAPVFHYVDSVILQSLWYITAFTTTASAYSYYHYGKTTVDILNHKK